MEEQFCDYGISFALKDLGFDERCLAYHSKEKDMYEDDNGGRTSLKILTYKNSGELSNLRFVTNSLFIYLYANESTSGELYCLSQSATAPLWQQAIDWVRKEHDIDIEIHSKFGQGNGWWANLCYNPTRTEVLNIAMFDNYNEARKQAIIESIEIIKTKTL